MLYIFLSLVFTEDCKNISGVASPPPSVQNYEVCEVTFEERYTGFWWGNLRERDQLEDPGVDGG